MPIRYVIADGDCIESVAFRHGFRPETLWQHDLNAELRKVRADPHTLCPGDVINLPDLDPGGVAVTTGRVHTFRRRGVPAKVRLVLDDRGKPRANLAYTLTVGERKTEGVTGADGSLEQWIRPDAPKAVLTIGSTEVHEIELGALRPPAQEVGNIARLRNLGYLREESEDDDYAVAMALFYFQVDQKLEATGEADDATSARLLQEHGS